MMGAYHNALREEGGRDDLMTALETSWAEVEKLKAQVEMLRKAAQLGLARARVLANMRPKVDGPQVTFIEEILAATEPKS